MTDQPKECPCCGADAEVIDNQIVGGSTVLCTNGKCSLRTGLFLTRGMALAAWNKRITPAAIVLGELMAELRAKTGLPPE